jgi:hypothetical protein
MHFLHFTVVMLYIYCIVVVFYIICHCLLVSDNVVCNEDIAIICLFS